MKNLQTGIVYIIALALFSIVFFQTWEKHKDKFDGMIGADVNTVSVFLLAVCVLCVLAAILLFATSKSGGKAFLWLAGILGVVWLLGLDNIMYSMRSLVFGTGSSEIRTIHNGNVRLGRGETDTFNVSGQVRINNHHGWKLCIQPTGRFNIVQKNRNLTIWISSKSGRVETAIVTSMLPETPC